MSFISSERLQEKESLRSTFSSVALWLMEQAGKTWNSLQKRCHSLFLERERRTPRERAWSLSTSTQSASVDVAPERSSERDCVMDEEHTVTLGGSADVCRPRVAKGAGVGMLRDSYFRFAPWTSRKKRPSEKQTVEEKQPEEYHKRMREGNYKEEDDAHVVLSKKNNRLLEEGEDGEENFACNGAEQPLAVFVSTQGQQNSQENDFVDRVCIEHTFPSHPPRPATLRQRFSETVAHCFPTRWVRVQDESLRPTPSHRKIHLSELMLDHCPFPAGSELARKWYLIKRHTAPLSRGPSSPNETGSATPATPIGEDEEDALRERRRRSIEEGVEPPPHAHIHTVEASVQVNPLYRLGPKLAAGMGELLVNGEGGSATITVPGTSWLPTVEDQEDDITEEDEVGLEQEETSCQAEPPEEERRAVTTGASLCLYPWRSRSRDDSITSTGTVKPLALIQQPAITQQMLPGVASATLNHRAHTQIDYIHCLVPDLLEITRSTFYWGVMDRYEAEALLEGRPEGTFLLRDSAQEDYLFSVSFRRYGRSLHARVEQWNHNFSFDAHDPCVFHAPTVTSLLRHYKEPSACMFFEPLLATPLCRTFCFGLQRLCRAAICQRLTYDGIETLPLPHTLKEYLREYHYKQKVRVCRLDQVHSYVK
uniref:suppressor of cytokine signaling 5 isoform X1 n=2 Tax=Myxine glutinosa TaxID=7769 RepID=UPI00358E9BE1